eukprot:10701302-Ditylum_brightwellii.AAC.1
MAGTVQHIASQIQGSARPGGVEAVSWQDWLLRFGAASLKLREAVAKLTWWLANTRPAWAAYRVLVAGRLIALDKCPGVRPVGVGEILLRMMGKCIIAVCGEDATQACGIQQLCSGLKAGIEGAVHTMNQLWVEHADEENWDILLVDAKNAFNQINRQVMLWEVQHLWAAGSRFAFNTYHHWRKLVLRGQDELILSKEG